VAFCGNSVQNWDIRLVPGVASITAVHRIVTTPGIDAAEAEAIRDLGIDLIIATPEAPFRRAR